MHKTNYAFDLAVANLLHAVPNPLWWSGAAANACATRIEDAVAELRALEARVDATWLP